MKESWSFAKSEEVVNNATSFNFFLQIQGENGNLAIDDEVDVAALYNKEIGTTNNFNDARITNVKDPIDDNDVATKNYVDNSKKIIEIKSETIMLSSGRIIRAGISGQNNIATQVSIEINGPVSSTFHTPINQHHSVTIFQITIEVSIGDVINFESSSQIIFSLFGSKLIFRV